MEEQTPEDVELQHAERRRELRMRTFKMGKLLFGGFTTMAVDCRIVEMSGSGARVETGVMVPVPDLLQLQMVDGTRRDARRAWAVGNQIGLQFLDEIPK
jgi:hypothetical protein